MPRRAASGLARKAIATDEFEFPIATPKGQVIETVREAFDYIDALPTTKQQSEPWRRVIGYLHRAVKEDRAWLFFARMSMMRALAGERSRDPEIKPRTKKNEEWRERRAALKAHEDTKRSAPVLKKGRKRSR